MSSNNHHVRLEADKIDSFKACSSWHPLNSRFHFPNLDYTEFSTRFVNRRLSNITVRYVFKAAYMITDDMVFDITNDLLC